MNELEKLNVYCNGYWSFEVKEHETNATVTQCHVLGRLTVYKSIPGPMVNFQPIIKEQWGSSDISMYPVESLKRGIVNTSEDFNKASQNSLHKCIQLLNI